MTKKLTILGTRGIPPNYGGFETFAYNLSKYLIAKGWKVSVFCSDDHGMTIWEDDFEGIHRVHIPNNPKSRLATIPFDWKATKKSLQDPGLVLLLGYSTAVFNLLNRMGKQKIVMNMDGIEWLRKKWKPHEKLWLYINEKIGVRIASHIIGDHPVIVDHYSKSVKRDKISMIAYGSESLKDVSPDPIYELGLEPNKFCLILCRVVPENSILEMIKAFSRKKRGYKLYLLGDKFDRNSPYAKEFFAAASDEVIIPEGFYDKRANQALRFHCRLYLHGHTVGGTNPSLVEALGAGSPVLAHNNPFNRWVAGDAGRFFGSEEECDVLLNELLENDEILQQMTEAAKSRHQKEFTWDHICSQYEELFFKIMR